ncbi:hypothetical protein CEXT_177011 [Caerostris extrusa]|uniref:Ig-like domain-containing protein n=1 Tax=Caerostris extrusa TaxID=172846 RepID=A0AAV4N526_CAEEX|nr:hypothetical protein CEXT_177011 [Caerostris extrusa]
MSPVSETSYIVSPSFRFRFSCNFISTKYITWQCGSLSNRPRDPGAEDVSSGDLLVCATEASPPARITWLLDGNILKYGGGRTHRCSVALCAVGSLWSGSSRSPGVLQTSEDGPRETGPWKTSKLLLNSQNSLDVSISEKFNL